MVPFENSIMRVLHKFAYTRVESESLNSTDSVMSAEPGRKTAYSNDLCWRIVYQRIPMNLPLYWLFEESGTVDPLSLRKRLDCRRLDLCRELHVVGVILENPSMYLGELCVGGYAGVWYRDFPKYCVQDTEKIWTHKKEDSSSCVAAI